MKKVVWITILNKEKDDARARKLHQTVATYGLQPEGHFWQDNLEQMAWAAPREELVKKETALWIILGSAEDLEKESVRYGLSLLSLMVQTQKGHGFPIMIALTGGEIEAGLPTPLKAADILSSDQASLGAKIVAKANMPLQQVETEYRLDIFAVPGIGQWFEVGPAKGHDWPGVMFGVCGAEINAHGVGPCQKLPEKSIVEYPMKGLELGLGESQYTAWAVKNKLTGDDSYYLRVKDFPSSILFGPMSEGDDAEVFVVTLK